MPQALQERPRNSAPTNAASSSPERAAGPTLDSHADSEHGHASGVADPAAVSKLNTLLEADPVNLAEVGDAIRAHPALESLILELCESLALTLGFSVCSAEEAAIVLGKDRLRILARSWSTMQLREPARCGNCAGDVSGVRHEYRSDDAGNVWSARPHTLEMTPEALRLANFLRSCGADVASLVRGYAETKSAAPNFAPEPSVGATSLLARDLLLLMPFVENITLTPEQRAALLEMLQFCR